MTFTHPWVLLFGVLPIALAAWEAQLRRSARALQEADPDMRQYQGWRLMARKARYKVRQLCGVKQKW